MPHRSDVVRGGDAVGYPVVTGCFRVISIDIAMAHGLRARLMGDPRRYADSRKINVRPSIGVSVKLTRIGMTIKSGAGLQNPLH